MCWTVAECLNPENHGIIYYILFKSFHYISSSFHSVVLLYYFRFTPVNCWAHPPLLFFSVLSFNILSSIYSILQLYIAPFFLPFIFSLKYTLIFHWVLTAVLICSPYCIDMILLTEGQQSMCTDLLSSNVNQIALRHLHSPNDIWEILWMIIFTLKRLSNERICYTEGKNVKS